MSEQTYKERLDELADTITKLKKEAYFLGPDTMQARLSMLDSQAQRLVNAPVPEYNPTSGAGEDEMELVDATDIETGEIVKRLIAPATDIHLKDAPVTPVEREKPLRIPRALRSAEAAE